MHGTSKLSNLRAQRGTTSIGDLAKKAGLSDWTIRNVEAGGNIQNHDAQKLATALGVSLATLGQTEL